MAEKFQPVSSDLTLKERKEARSLRSVDLSDAEIGNRQAFEEWLLEKDINDHIESLSAVSTLLECIRTDCEQQDKDSVVRHVGQSETAREKYIKTLPFMMAVSESMQWMVHMQSPDSDHHEKLAMDDMPKVLKIRDTVMECMRNPFASTVAAEKLVNIAKGELFTSSDVVDSKQLGLDVIAHVRSTDAEKIISPKILTFAGQQKQTKKRQDSMKQIVSEEGTVTRALCFTRKLTEEDKAGYKMRKGNKADFLDTLQNKVSDTWKPLEELPPSALTPVYVIDAMTSVQRFQTLGDSKFNQLQERYKDKIMKMKPMKPKMKPSVPSVMRYTLSETDRLWRNELEGRCTLQTRDRSQGTKACSK
ncbi:hypothetical protein GQR58_002498 [Nymphon striatum]|nr:hypothetical protein GQR58_002498 [Nymphon striatum]